MYNGAHFMSRMFRPSTAIFPEKSNKISKSHKLMLYAGLISNGARGTFVLSPSLVRSVEKLTQLVDAAMRGIGAEKIVMPALGDAKLWRKSGRWESMGPEMFRLQDRHGTDICLSPTNEEEVTNMIASLGKNISHKHLPIRLYQITTKFRDEVQPCYGLLRAREFIMKDLYTFDECDESAHRTYNEVITAYRSLFSSLQVPFHQVEAATGVIGGNYSHEFHVPAEIGEDLLHICPNCDIGRNSETLDASRPDLQCSKCGSDLLTSLAIEVGHCFALGQKYSRPFEASFKSKDGDIRPTMMGCYGIGITRLIAACLESLSTEEELRWPRRLAPFQLGIVLPKEGSKGVLPDAELTAFLKTVASLCPEGDLLIDDRPKLTIGRKLLDLRRMGVPWVVVAKMKNQAHAIELIDIYGNVSATLPSVDVVSFLASRLLGDFVDVVNEELTL